MVPKGSIRRYFEMGGMRTLRSDVVTNEDDWRMSAPNAGRKPGENKKMSTYKELLARKRELDAEIEAVRQAARDEARETIKNLMREFAIGANELTAKRGPKKSGSQPPKYRDPASGVTWSGKGREPRWIAGKDRREFAI